MRWRTSMRRNEEEVVVLGDAGCAVMRAVTGL